MMTVPRLVMQVSLPFALALAVPVDGKAQVASPTKLAEILPDLILREITLPRDTTAALSHTAHFSPIDANELDNPAVAIVRNFNKLMMMQLSTYPLGSPAGGFTYTFDESLGTFRRNSTSFGPSFAERAVTMGRHKLNVGFTYQQTSYNTFEGQNLGDGSIKFYLRHQDCCSSGSGSGTGTGSGRGGGGGPIEVPNGTRLDPPFEGDLIQAALSLKARTDTAAFSVNYGLTNRWDVGLVVPVVRVDLQTDVRATILRLATASDPLTHTFEVGNPNATEKTFHGGGTASGLGDAVLRSKYRLVGFSGGGLAGGVDLRLPTGDRNNLLGAGGQARMFLIQSGGADRLMEHVNAGYTSAWGKVPNVGLLSLLGGAEPVPDEVNYAAGIEFAAESRLTIVGDILGRTLRDAGRLGIASKPFVYQGRTAVETAYFDEFEPRAGNLNLTLGTVGIKFNPAGDWLVSASVLFPVTKSGLRSRLTTVVGLDHAF
jgi:hypothetical protein